MDDREGSPLWWLDRLYRRLVHRSTTINKHIDYYEGRHRLTFVSAEYRQEFAAMLAGVTDNWMALVVDAVEERLHIDGFRFGGPDDTEGDAEAWGLWQRNMLDADSELVHSMALQAGSAAVMVWPSDDGDPLITIEDPREVIVAYAPGSRRERAAALKAWRDEWTGKVRANVYLPDGIYKFEATSDSSDLELLAAAAKPLSSLGSGTVWRVSSEDDGFVPSMLDTVPIVEFQNRPRMRGAGRSEIEDVISTQDQINKLVCDMLVAAEFSAFRQRWATGVEIPQDPASGEDLDPTFQAAVNRLWTVSAPDAKFGEFNATDLATYVRAIENRVQSLASRTRTPPHYLLGQSGSFPSGESLKATETGLIAKVRSRARHFGESWEEVMRLAFRVTGDEARASAWSAETIWSDPESRSESEHVDALIKLRGLQVPLEQLWQDAGYTPQQIQRFQGMLLREALNSMLGQPSAPMADGAAAPVDVPVAGQPELDPDEVKKRADAMGVLIRAGVDQESAAERVGLGGVRFSGALPVSLRLPQSQAEALEG